MEMKLLTLFLTLCISGCQAGSTCWYYDAYYGYYQTYCEEGCCGERESNVCCEDNLAQIGIIVGGTVGGIVFIAVIVAITCCCIYVVKRNQRPNMVIHPTRENDVAAVSSGVPGPVPSPYMMAAGPSRTYQPNYIVPPPPPNYSSVALPMSQAERNDFK